MYRLLSETGELPERFLGTTPRPSRRERLRALFTRNSAKPFFVSGALLLLMSLFTIFPVYYLTAGSLLLLLSVGLRILAPSE